VFSASDRAAIIALIDESLSTGHLTLGPNTRRFEDALAAQHGVAHAVAVSSGTAALEIILRILGVHGREVIVPANTFFATAAAVVHAGGTPRFADIDPRTFALSAATLEAAITAETAGVVLVHIGGLVTPAVDDLRQLCIARGIFLVEDAAHAHGAAYRGRPAGSFGRAAALSFYPTKVITSGEGGAILTDDEHVRDEARIYRDQGKAGFFGGEHVRMGAAWRMSEVHAAIGVTQIARLEEFLARRRWAAARYDEALGEVDGFTPLTVPDGCQPNYYKYIALLDAGIERDRLKRRLRDDFGVGLSGEVYARPLHHEPIFAPWRLRSLPAAEDVCARHVCLPIHSDMTDAEVDHVVASLRRVLAEATSGGASGHARVTRNST
jgi:dTDP-4-amino-4,6-dideoxygalactose transaminase